jgi:hypothetical protein
MLEYLVELGRRWVQKYGPSKKTGTSYEGLTQRQIEEVFVEALRNYVLAAASTGEIMSIHNVFRKVRLTLEEDLRDVPDGK